MPPPIVIAGGGIGGLAAAVALGRAGLRVEVYERAPEIREVGAGLTVQCNAVLALGRLGLAPQVVAAGRTIRRTLLRTWRGATMAEIDATPIYAEIGAVSLGIHRATLQRILLEAAGPERVRTGADCTGYEPRAGGGVVVRFAGGREVEAAALIGADGLHSAIRAQLLADGAPRYSGYTCWRGVSSDAALVAGLDGLAFESWGPGRRFGGVSIDGGRFYWFATADAPAGERDPPGRAREGLLERFRGWHDPVERLIAGTPAEAIFRNDIGDRPPVQRWGEGAVTLLGDAAHPMTPNLGQGACQAIEDAVVLSRELAAAAPDLAAGLRRYEDRRRLRAHRFQERSWRLGRLGQLSGALGSGLRNLAVRLTPQAIVLRDLRESWRFEE